MSSIVFDPKGFLALEEEGADFINYVLEKTNDPFTFSKQADFEPMLDMLEKYLVFSLSAFCRRLFCSSIACTVLS